MTKLIGIGLSLCVLTACGRDAAPNVDSPNGGLTEKGEPGKDVAAVEVSLPDQFGRLHPGTVLLPSRVASEATRFLTDTRVILRSDAAFKARAGMGKPSDLTGIDTLSYAQRVTNARAQLDEKLAGDPGLAFFELVFEEKEVIGFDALVLPATAFEPAKKTKGVQHFGPTLTSTGAPVSSPTYQCPAGSEINYGQTNWIGGAFGTFDRIVNGSTVDNTGIWTHPLNFSLSNINQNHNNLKFTFFPDGNSSVYAHVWCYYFGI